jgi:outer membrane protein OmpA-like peptidoglycan-associated protein
MSHGKPVLDRNGNVNLKIYSSKFNGSTWSAAQELKINSNDFSNADPCVTKDGKRLYFVSNRPGGIGGKDIYYCDKIGTEWGPCQNPGPNINTEGDERFPTIAADGTLYFASDGYAGLGGLDLFSAKPNGSGFELARNLGAPINSSSDDFALIYDSQKDKGFFCSARNGNGNDDIFFYTHKKVQEMILAGTIHCADKNINLAGQRITVVKVNTGEVAELRLNDKERFDLVAEKGEQVVVYMSDKRFFDTTVPVFAYDVPTDLVDPYLNMGVANVSTKKQVDFKGNLASYEEKTIVPVKSALNVALSNSMNATASGGKGGRTSTPDLEDRGINNILFGYNSTNINPEDYTKLAEVCALMKENPSTRLIIRAFCDARGSFEYNKKLSMARAGAVKDYMTMKGIDQNRFSIEWFGEDNPLNDCGNQKKCKEEEYSVNRRAELKLVASK